MRALDLQHPNSQSQQSSLVNISIVHQHSTSTLLSPTPEMTTILTAESILNNDLMFTVGSIVECKTCFEEILTGEVLAFEYKNKILVLKIPSTTQCSNITCINLEYCSDIKIIKDMSETTNSSSNNLKLPDMNTNKLEERAKAAIKERNNLFEAFKSGVSSDGISLYLSLIKTIGGSVTLETLDDNKDHCIVIKKNTKITPPYSADCVQAVISSGNKTAGPMSTEAVKYARQLVEKFWRDQNKDPYSLSSSGPGSGSTNKTTTYNSNITTPSNNSINSSSNNTSKESSPNSIVTMSSPLSDGSVSSPVTTTTLTASSAITNTNVNSPTSENSKNLKTTNSRY